MLRYAIEATPSIYGSIMAIWMFYFIHEQELFNSREPLVPICFTSTLYLNNECKEYKTLEKIMLCFLKIVYKDVAAFRSDYKLKQIARNLLSEDGSSIIELFENSDTRHVNLIKNLFYRLIVANKETAILKELYNDKHNKDLSLETFMEIPSVYIKAENNEKYSIEADIPRESFNGLPAEKNTVTQNITKQDFIDVPSFVYDVQKCSWHFIQVVRHSVYTFKIRRLHKNGKVEENDITHELKQTITQNIFKLMNKEQTISTEDLEK